MYFINVHYFHCQKASKLTHCAHFLFVSEYLIITSSLSLFFFFFTSIHHESHVTSILQKEQLLSIPGQNPTTNRPGGGRAFPRGAFVPFGCGKGWLCGGPACTTWGGGLLQYWRQLCGSIGPQCATNRYWEWEPWGDGAASGSRSEHWRRSALRHTQRSGGSCRVTVVPQETQSRKTGLYVCLGFICFSQLKETLCISIKFYRGPGRFMLCSLDLV